ncbi:hypothetical protein AALA21_06180 [Eggerthellaceae bacterium 3-80]|nr:hypothetical protein D7W09_05790 [bacterium D16-34]
MDSLLVGNGINIQYGGSRCANKEIIKRAITSSITPDFPLKATTFTNSHQPIWLIGTLHSEIPNVIKGDFDEFELASFERDALISFKERYGSFALDCSPLKVGMEDYFFLLELFFKKHGIKNPDANAIREGFKRVFLYSIYDVGRVEKIFLKFPSSLKDFFDGFDVIFTTNYDSNIDDFCERTVFHLHGCFRTRSYLYDESSLRNKLSDKQFDSVYFDPQVSYLFSNAIFSYSGSLKEFQMSQASKTNTALEKFAEGYKKDERVKEHIEAWRKDNNQIMRNLAESILLKASDADIEFDEYYRIEEFKSVEGSLSIVGLSPNNDSHIFDLLKTNEGLSNVTYYYHSKSDIEAVVKLLPQSKLSFIDVKTLWAKYE